MQAETERGVPSAKDQEGDDEEDQEEEDQEAAAAAARTPGLSDGNRGGQARAKGQGGGKGAQATLGTWQGCRKVYRILSLCHGLAAVMRKS